MALVTNRARVVEGSDGEPDDPSPRAGRLLSERSLTPDEKALRDRNIAWLSAKQEAENQLWRDGPMFEFFERSKSDFGWNNFTEFCRSRTYQAFFPAETDPWDAKKAGEWKNAWEVWRVLRALDLCEPAGKPLGRSVCVLLHKFVKKPLVLTFALFHAACTNRSGTVSDQAIKKTIAAVSAHQEAASSQEDTWAVLVEAFPVVKARLYTEKLLAPDSTAASPVLTQRARVASAGGPSRMLLMTQEQPAVQQHATPSAAAAINAAAGASTSQVQQSAHSAQSARQPTHPAQPVQQPVHSAQPVETTEPAELLAEEGIDLADAARADAARAELQASQACAETASQRTHSRSRVDAVVPTSEPAPDCDVHTSSRHVHDASGTASREVVAGAGAAAGGEEVTSRGASAVSSEAGGAGGLGGAPGPTLSGEDDSRRFIACLVPPSPPSTGWLNHIALEGLDEAVQGPGPVHPPSAPPTATVPLATPHARDLVMVSTRQQDVAARQEAAQQQQQQQQQQGKRSPEVAALRPPSGQTQGLRFMAGRPSGTTQVAVGISVSQELVRVKLTSYRGSRPERQDVTSATKQPAPAPAAARAPMAAMRVDPNTPAAVPTLEPAPEFDVPALQAALQGHYDFGSLTIESASGDRVVLACDGAYCAIIDGNHEGAPGFARITVQRADVSLQQSCRHPDCGSKEPATISARLDATQMAALWTAAARTASGRRMHGVDGAAPSEVVAGAVADAGDADAPSRDALATRAADANIGGLGVTAQVRRKDITAQQQQQQQKSSPELITPTATPTPEPGPDELAVLVDRVRLRPVHERVLAANHLLFPDGMDEEQVKAVVEELRPLRLYRVLIEAMGKYILRDITLLATQRDKACARVTTVGRELQDAKRRLVVQGNRCDIAEAGLTCAVAALQKLAQSRLDAAATQQTAQAALEEQSVLAAVSQQQQQQQQQQPAPDAAATLAAALPPPQQPASTARAAPAAAPQQQQPALATHATPAAPAQQPQPDQATQAAQAAVTKQHQYNQAAQTALAVAVQQQQPDQAEHAASEAEAKQQHSGQVAGAASARAARPVTELVAAHAVTAIEGAEPTALLVPPAAGAAKRVAEDPPIGERSGKRARRKRGEASLSDSGIESSSTDRTAGETTSDASGSGGEYIPRKVPAVRARKKAKKTAGQAGVPALATPFDATVAGAAPGTSLNRKKRAKEVLGGRTKKKGW